MNNAFFKHIVMIIVFALTIFSTCAFSFNIENKKPLPIHYGGRVVVNKLDHMSTYTYSWPGVYFETAFIGTEVDLKLNDSNNILKSLLMGKRLSYL